MTLRALSTWGFVLLITGLAFADEANYDEAKVLPYTLPDPLVLANGDHVTDSETWRTRRRPELLKLFAEEAREEAAKIREKFPLWEQNALDADALVRWYAYDSTHDVQANSLLAKGTTWKAIDATTVDIDLPTPYRYVPEALANYTLAVYDSDVVASVGGKFEQLAGKGIFTGPYAYAGSTGDTITYTANPYYYLGAPRFAKETLHVISDAASGLQAIENGEADLQVFPSSDESRSIGAGSKAHFLASSPAVTYTGAVLDAKKAPFDDERVRQAFALAIDNAAISKTVMNGVNRPLSGTFPEDEPLGVSWKTFDAGKAAALLDAAGWTKGPDGVRAKDGKKLTVDLATYDEDLKRVGTAVIGMLGAVGFDARLNALDGWDAVKTAITDPGAGTNAMLENLQSYGYDGNKYSAVAKDYAYGNGYDVVVDDPDIAALMKTVLTSTDQQAADDAFRQAQTLNGQRVYYVPIVENPTSVVTSDAFAKMVVDPFSYFITSTLGPDAP